MNTDKDDIKSDSHTIKYGTDIVYFHYDIEGPEDKNVNVKGIFSGGGYSSSPIYVQCSKGVNAWFSHYNIDGSPIARGSYTLEIYNADDDKLMGAVSFVIE